MRNTSTIDYRNHDRRLDHWLLSIYPDTPKSHIQKMIRKGVIKVNQKKTTANYRIQNDDIITYPAPQKTSSCEAPYRRKHSLKPFIQLENDDFLIINKPPGIPVHSGTGYTHGLIDDLEDDYGHKLYLVHRLDRLTSGVMVIAKHPVMQNTLSDKFRNRDLSKIYHCIVQNWNNGDQITVRVPLLRVREDHCDTNIVDPNGVDSISEFTRIKTVGPYTLLEVKLITGRMHQIRAHLKYLKAPILGDDLYGIKSASNKTPGLMLLAKKLSFSLNNHDYHAEAQWPDKKLHWLSKHGIVTPI